jgi:hypothetical protein
MNGRSYCNGQYDQSWVAGKIKKAMDYMNMGTLQKYHFPYRMIEFLPSI